MKEYIYLTFHCQIRLDSINDEKLNILKSAGCTGFSVGIECASESYRINYLNRKLSNDKIIEKCNLLLLDPLLVSLKPHSALTDI